MQFFLNHKKYLLFIPLGLILIVLMIFGLLPTPSTPVVPSASPSASLKIPAVNPIVVEYPYTDPSDKFVISYYPKSDAYTISILSSPFDTVRTLAEQAFLKQLKLTKAAACKKSVVVATPRYANPDQAGQKFPLSFCDTSTP